VNLNKIIISLYLIITSAFIIMALIAKDTINSQLFACLGIIIGAVGSQYVSKLNIPIDEN
jgi:hypothetical protein